MRAALLALGVFTGLVVAACPQAAAHQQKASITEVSVNSRSGKLEIAHRFYLHDAEHALEQLTGRTMNLHAHGHDQDLFASAIAESFSLTRPDGTLVALQLLGSQVERGYIWVYQEGPADALADGLIVRASALQDVWPGQINTVNFHAETGIASLEFRGATTAQTLHLTDGGPRLEAGSIQ